MHENLQSTRAVGARLGSAQDTRDGKVLCDQVGAGDVLGVESSRVRRESGGRGGKESDPILNRQTMVDLLNDQFRDARLIHRRTDAHLVEVKDGTIGNRSDIEVLSYTVGVGG